MKLLNWLYPVLLFCLFSKAEIFGQVKTEEKTPKTPNIVVDMIDGTRVQGKLVERRGDTVVIETITFGRLNLNIKNIKNLSEIDKAQFVGNEFWFENPHASRNFFAPTGIGLRKGEGYYQNIYVYLQHIAYGFTDHFTIGAGFDVIGPIVGQAPFMMYITPKVSFDVSEKLHLGAGALIGTFGAGFGDGRVNANLLYGVGTIGNRNNNATLGLGYGLANGEWGRRPTITLSAQTRVGRKWCLMTENYIFDTRASSDFKGLSILGARLMGEKYCFDFGFLRPWLNLDSDVNFFAIPYLSVSLPFGRKKR